MPQQAMLAQLWDLVDEPRAIPPVAELVELGAEIDQARAVLAELGRGPHPPLARWFSHRYIEMIERRMAGKPIDPADVAELIDDVKSGGVWRQTVVGGDTYAARRAECVAVLERIAEAAGQPIPPVSCEWRRRQATVMGLLTVAVASPGTARHLGLLP